MKYQVYYMRPEQFRTFIFGDKKPVLASLDDTHIHLMDKDAEGLEDLYFQMQGEIWSPNGEARELIRGKGLRHTSMSIGDVAVNTETNEVWVVATFGYTKLGVVGNA